MKFKDKKQIFLVHKMIIFSKFSFNLRREFA